MKRGNFTVTCEKCDHEMSLSLTSEYDIPNKKSDRIKVIKKKKIETEPQNTDLLIMIPENMRTNIRSMKSFPVYFEIKHKGFWITNNLGIHDSTEDDQTDRNSVMFTNDCLLYVYKLALRHLLLSLKVISPADIDPANLVPHMLVRKNKNDPFSKYKVVQNKKIVVREEMLSAKSDFLIMEIDEKQDLHSTLIYSKKINRRVNLIESIKTVIQVLNAYPDLILEYKSLPYFGQNAIEYWYDHGNKYPFNVKPPEDYKPKEQETEKFGY